MLCNQPLNPLQIIAVIFGILFLYNLLQSSLSIVRSDQFIHFNKGLMKSLRIIFLIVISVLFEMLWKLLFYKQCYLTAYILIQFIPPCPSKTPKRWWSMPLNFGIVKCASSMKFLQPTLILLYPSLQQPQKINYFLLSRTKIFTHLV